MKIRALFLDIDGTLLNSSHLIGAATRQRLLSFQKQGGRIILSSARPYIGMRQYGRELRLEEYGGFYMALNGGQIVDASTLKAEISRKLTSAEISQVFQLVNEVEGSALLRPLSDLEQEILKKGSLTIQDAWNIDHILMRNSLNILTYQNDTVVAKRLEVYAAAESIVNHMKLQIAPNLMEHTDLEVVKFLISGDPSLIRQVYPIFKSQLNHLEVVTSDPFLIEATPQGINKGKALESLLMHLGIPVFDAAAIGDSDNDLSMIKSAGMGVAMGNATASIKAAANYVTKTNDEDGIAFFLDQVVL